MLEIRKYYREIAACRKPPPSRLIFYDRVSGDIPEELKGFSLGCGNPASHARCARGGDGYDSRVSSSNGSKVSSSNGSSVGDGPDSGSDGRDHGSRGCVRVLDVGCGALFDLANLSVFPGLANAGRFGMDACLELMLRGRRLVKSGPNGFRLANADARSLPFKSGSFDLVISNAVLNLVPDKPAALGEIKRVLKPGGELVDSDIVFEDFESEEFRTRVRRILARFDTNDGLHLVNTISEIGPFQKALEAVFSRVEFPEIHPVVLDAETVSALAMKYRLSSIEIDALCGLRHLIITADCRRD